MNKKELLVVDDDTTICFMFGEVFDKAGYSVRTAETAEDALEILKEKYFPVMILDLKLPGMNGIELCKEVKKDKPDTIILAITAYASLFEISDCLEAGFNDYFTKPVKLEIISEAVKDAFAKIERREKVEGGA